jgi:hypothetical protein
MNVFRYAVRSLLKLFGQGEKDLVMLKPRYDLLNEKLLNINPFIFTFNVSFAEKGSTP